MPYPFDETFASGIPAGFGTAGGAGGVTAAWNSAAQAADLVFTASTSFWRITAAELAFDFWFEMDVEVVASSGAPTFGFWLWTGTGYEGHRLAIDGSFWNHSYRTSTNAASETLVAVNAAWASVGSRKTIRLDVKRTPRGEWDLMLSIDGAAAWREVRRYYSTFLPCVAGSGITLRLHRAAGGTPSALSEAPTVVGRALPSSVAARILVPEHAAALRFNARGLRPLVAARNLYFAGNGRIVGTVKEKASPDRPLARRVLLLSENTNIVAAETWSDAAGDYRFERIDPSQRYTVVAYDNPPRLYRAVIADNLQPELMP